MMSVFRQPPTIPDEILSLFYKMKVFLILAMLAVSSDVEGSAQFGGRYGGGGYGIGGYPSNQYPGILSLFYLRSAMMPN